jgi:hypothetical protein
MKTALLLSAVLLLSVTYAFAEDEPPRGGRDPWQRLGRMDANGDGKVSREEFRGPERLFERLDGDGDGFVTKKEASAMRDRLDRRGGGSGRSMRGGQGVGLERLDADKDGRVSKKEWDAFFEKADENGDGVLQREEWDAAVGGRPVRDDAPKVGDPAPKVKAKLLDTPFEVDLGSPKRTTVLVFGSWT